MGNAAGASWFSFTEETTLVLLRLHDARHIDFANGETICGIVSLGADDPEAALVRLDTPAQFAVGASSSVTLTFQAVRPGSSVHHGRYLGEVSLPLEHIAKKCGGSLYHMWLPVQPEHGNGALSSGALSSGEAAYEHFAKALRNAARDPRLPMVSLSLCRADLPGADLEFYQPSATSADKALHFYSLLQSHAQHARLVQALYRQCRSHQQGRGDSANGYPQDPLANSFAVHPGASPPRRSGSDGGLDFGLGGISEDARFEAKEPAMLRQELDSMTEEANARINQASDAIRMLKERLSAKSAENDQLKQETVQFRREATELEIENERLGLQLERRERDRGDNEEREVDSKRLKREVEVLQEQKEALLLILNDLYGHLGSPPPVATAEAAAAPSATASTATPAETSSISPGTYGSPQKSHSSEQEGWTNMLPRPSEIFASGVLDDA